MVHVWQTVNNSSNNNMVQMTGTDTNIFQPHFMLYWKHFYQWCIYKLWLYAQNHHFHACACKQELLSAVITTVNICAHMAIMKYGVLASIFFTYQIHTYRAFLSGLLIHKIQFTLRKFTQLFFLFLQITCHYVAKGCYTLVTSL